MKTGKTTKQLFVLLALFFHAQLVRSQHYVRTKKNIGFFASAGFPDYAVCSGLTKSMYPGTSYSLGITHQTGSILYPELFYVSHQSSLNLPDASGHWSPTAFNSQALGIGIVVKLDFLTFNQHKKKGNCFGRMLNILGGAELTYPIGMQPAVNGTKLNPELAIKLGLGMHSIWGGASKGHMSWTIHWELYVRQGLNPAFLSDFNTGTNKYTFSSLCLALRIIYHKSYKFSDM